MGESSPLGSVRIVTLPVSELQTSIAALSCAAAGWEVYPIYSADDQGVCTCPKRKRCEDPDKPLTTPHGFNDGVVRSGAHRGDVLPPTRRECQPLRM